MVNSVGRFDFLNDLPPVEFCCAYGSALLGNNDKTTMADYILGVSDPLQWHSQNLEMNRDHYASWTVYLGGAKLITQVADGIGVGVHFNPFVVWNDRMIKYGVVRMQDLVEDILHWKHFYLSGRLQKPVSIQTDNLDISNLNLVNLKAATSAALLLLPPEFSEEQLYAKICGLSYMGDLRMLFAEDRNKVNKIVQGQFHLFQTMYKPVLEEYAAKDLLKFPFSGGNSRTIGQTMYKPVLEEYAAKHLLRFPSSGGNSRTIRQDCGFPATQLIASYLPPTIKSRMGMTETRRSNQSNCVRHEVLKSSREEASNCMRKTLRRTVMVSSTRQAISGVLAAGGMNAAWYLSNKMRKWWNS